MNPSWSFNFYLQNSLNILIQITVFLNMYPPEFKTKKLLYMYLKCYSLVTQVILYFCVYIYSYFESALYFLKSHNKFQLLRNVIAVLHQLKVSATIVAAVRNVEWGISSPSLLRSPVSHVRKDPIQGKCLKDFRNSRIQFSKFPDINCGFIVVCEGTNVCGFHGSFV